MLSSDGVLHAIAEAYGGSIHGRTLLQKIAYFIGDKLEIDLGYGAHYYGPYSKEMTASLQDQMGIGALIENRKESRHLFAGHDGAKVFYEYTVTKRGLTARELHQQWGGDDYKKAVKIAKKIKSLKVDYMPLAFASKVHYILSRAKDEVMNSKGVTEEAGKLGWSMSEDDVRKGIEILTKLDYIEPE